MQTLTRQSWVNLAADCLVGIDTDGVFRAVGQNSFRPGLADELAINLFGGVDPEWRGKGVGRALLQWQRSRAEQNVIALRSSELEAERLPAKIMAYVEEQMFTKQRLFEAAGFKAVRLFTELRRPLGANSETGSVAAIGVGLQMVNFSDKYAEATRLAHNEAFANHWGSKPHDPESWRTNLLEDEAFRPEQSFVVVDTAAPDRSAVAYVINMEYTQDWPYMGFTEGYTELLGVRPAWRGRGLAKHLLARKAREFSAAGHPFATLGVDTENRSSALGLYLSVGYEPVRRPTVYDVEA